MNEREDAESEPALSSAKTPDRNSVEAETGLITSGAEWPLEGGIFCNGNFSCEVCS
jgi:hypothetical protein